MVARDEGGYTISEETTSPRSRFRSEKIKRDCNMIANDHISY